ncbi:MAG: 5'-deoxynucleotidase [Oscillospiraceae bacterium]|nr:5'-deoxynucleotidase [Oscillospiraceae bacterium]MCL2278004.1 5'-deoxynucleotidase [Oscillospiraceae bacterium]
MDTKYSFYALISRMKYITRWSLMRNSESENVQEHSHMVAVFAHALAVIRRDIYGRKADPGLAAQIALFHDSSEIFTGDLPTPVKYFDPEIMDAYKNVEAVASKKLITALPSELRLTYKKLLSPQQDDEMYALVKAADKLSAYVKCLEELKAGNPEFKNAAKQCKQKLDALSLPEVVYFMEHFLPAFELTLDELDFTFE